MASLPLARPIEHALQRVCAWCRRVEQNGRWHATASESHTRVSHGICPDCFDEALAAR
jgi:hypothetical protein